MKKKVRAKIIDFKTRAFARRLCAEAGLTKDGQPSHLRLVSEDSDPNLQERIKKEEISRIVEKADSLGLGASGFVLEFAKLKIDRLVEKIIAKASEFLSRK